MNTWSRDGPYNWKSHGAAGGSLHLTVSTAPINYLLQSIVDGYDTENVSDKKDAKAVAVQVQYFKYYQHIQHSNSMPFLLHTVATSLLNAFQV